MATNSASAQRATTGENHNFLHYAAKPPSTLHSFGRFPKEIKDMIWELSLLNESRVLEFRMYNVSGRRRRTGGRDRRSVKCVSHPGAPPSLLVCSGSRELSWQSDLNDTYVNWDRDIVFFKPDLFHLLDRQLCSDKNRGVNLPIKEDTDLPAVKKAKNTVIQRINRNACNIAIGTETMIDLNFILVGPDLFFPQAEKVIIIQTVKFWGHEDGKIFLVSPVKRYSENPFPTTQPHHHNSWAILKHIYHDVSLMKAMRGNSPLLTREEKDERRMVKAEVES